MSHARYRTAPPCHLFPEMRGRLLPASRFCGPLRLDPAPFRGVDPVPRATQRTAVMIRIFPAMASGKFYRKNSFAVSARLDPPDGFAFGAEIGARVVADMRVNAASIRPRFVIAA